MLRRRPVSRSTLRQVLAILAESGIIRRGPAAAQAKPRSVSELSVLAGALEISPDCRSHFRSHHRAQPGRDGVMRVGWTLGHRTQTCVPDTCWTPDLRIRILAHSPDTLH